MDKQMFLDILEKKLLEYPISKEDVEKHVADMEKFLATVSDEEFAKENPGENEIAEIALNVIERASNNSSVSEEKVAQELEVKAEETAEAEEKTEAEPEAEPEAEEMPAEAEDTANKEEAVAEVKDDADVLEILAKEAEEERKDKETFEELKRLAIERAIAEQDEIIVNAVEENDPIQEIVDPEERPDIAFAEAEAIKILFEDEEISKTDELVNIKAEPEKEPEPKDDSYTINDANDFLVEEDELVQIEDLGDEYELKKTKRKKKREKVKATPLFWALSILTLPITLPLLLDIALLFGIAYLAVTLLIIAFSAAMIGCVAVGTALALIGVIYGGIECTRVPVLGIFEIGLGVTVGGATILISVLLYNVAIRYLPKLYKCLALLAGWVVEKLADIVYAVKKGCGRK